MRPGVRRLSVVLAALALCGVAACTSAASGKTAPPSAPVQTAASPALPATSSSDDPAACAARGGVVRPICRMQRPTCVVPYADAGRTCRNDADCEGRCIAKEGGAPGQPATGRCQANSNPCGCTTLVDKGVVTGVLCVD